MNTAKLLNIITDQNSLKSEKLEDLKSLSSDFPYFQSAKLLYLKKLYQVEDYHFNSFLKLTAAYSGDRSVLFDYITKFVEEEEKIENKGTDALEGQSTEGISEEESKEPSVHQILKFKQNDRLSFTEWLQLISLNEDTSDESTKTETEESKIDKKTKENVSRKDILVDKFINSNPTLKPKKTESTNQNIASNSTVENEGWMTETLAQVFVEQKKYSKAIKAYKILGLKYPEKSGFFADRIRSIERLMIK